MKPKTIDRDALYAKPEVAAILGKPPDTFSRWAKRHGLRFSQRRGGYITGRALLEWIEKQQESRN